MGDATNNRFYRTKAADWPDDKERLEALLDRALDDNAKLRQEVELLRQRHDAMDELRTALTEAVRLYENYDLTPNLDGGKVGKWINQARDALAER